MSTGIAITVFVVAYLSIATERIPKTAAALGGAARHQTAAVPDRRGARVQLVLAAVFAAFIGHSVFHIEPSVVALLGAGVLVLISGTRPRTTSPGSSGRRCCSSRARSSWSARWSRPVSSESSPRWRPTPPEATRSSRSC
ncbi:Na+/H+ antiporter NhaD/arsenite permease-like protein [Actinophytocola algeriensis]|uniref:Na+/H+ antiporter NhaD/arsenite permease-like protein n=1 Tax=Actinophytocola algeriensis TaxID=1768010 RepID=A0A7W7QE34_9PSEU|nr:Na+/H+ antiporter NhaD/arsenite permease-like protein [Actinophytocola algeriensis]MBE1473413.1 Na+/H+ antiporter NhaD/arsenite permease-like protein [Actinophytocola algeriensis]